MEFYYGEYNPNTHKESPAVLMKAKTLTGAKREAGRIGTIGFPQAIGLSKNDKGGVAEYISRRWNFKGEPWADETETPAWAKMETSDMHITPEKMKESYAFGCYPSYDELDMASFSPLRDRANPSLLISVCLTLYYQEKYGFFVKINQHELQAINGKWHWKRSIPNTEDHYFLGNSFIVNKKNKIKYGYYFQRYKRELLNRYTKEHHLEEICPTPIL